jgi:phage terminase large subunit GpA-like protein
MPAVSDASDWRHAFLGGVRPVVVLTVGAWAEQFRRLPRAFSAIAGRFRVSTTAYLVEVLEALDDPATWKVVVMKAAQVGWTDGVVCNWLGRNIDLDPTPIVGLFPKREAAQDFVQERFEPMVESTPALAAKVDTSQARRSDNRRLWKRFTGGFLKLVGSNSTSSVKSTSAPRVFVEEPDDCARNVKGQGDSIALLEERTKTFPRRKVLMGGTPTIKGASSIEEEYDGGDRRVRMVPCHHCGDEHVLEWDNVKWDEDASADHEHFGRALPETAYYACPHCGGIWNDYEKRRNVKRGRWVARAAFHGVRSFHIPELLSPFHGSRLEVLVARYLKAKAIEEAGDETEIIAFVNNCLGLPYEVSSDLPALADLQARGLDYPENTIPAGGLVLTAGVDVQHDRLAIIVRAWGREEESYLVAWLEIYGTVIDTSSPVWAELDAVLLRDWPHALGGSLRVEAGGIDCGDGVTADAVYTWVRAKTVPGMVAVKGSSNDRGRREIYTSPSQSVDAGRKRSKAAKYGLRVYVVGTHKAKDLIYSRLKLEGVGAGRMYWPASVRADYLEQLTSEIKVPVRGVRGAREYRVRSGVRNEASDGEVYALHSARRRRLHIKGAEFWAKREADLAQADLWGAAALEPVGASSGATAMRLARALERAREAADEAAEETEKTGAGAPGGAKVAGSGRFRVNRAKSQGGRA